MTTELLEKKASAPSVTLTAERQHDHDFGIMALWRNRHLLKIMIWRDYFGKYRGSLLGALWPLINPLGHLVLYTFVFSLVLKVRFGNDPGMGTYALYLMTGLLPWGALAESLSRAPACILEVPNLVKRVVFPLEVLPVALVASSVMGSLMGLSVLLVVAAVAQGTIHWTIVYLPLIVLSQAILMIGISWLMAALGVFLQDLRHMMSLFLSAWMYTSPVIYPATAFPAEVKFLAWLNPMAGIITDYRRALLQGLAPDWSNFAFYTTVGIVFWVVGYYVFSRTKHSFADVM